MDNGSPQPTVRTVENRTRWIITCFAIGFLCIFCALVLLGVAWIEHNRLHLFQGGRPTLTPASTVTVTSRPTHTLTIQPTQTETSQPTDTPLTTDTSIPTASYTPTRRPTKTPSTTPSATPKPSLIAGESPFLPAPAFPECTNKRTDSFTAGSKFSELNESYVSGEIVSDEYRMTMKDANVWAWSTDGIKTGDAIYEVDVEQTAIGSGAYGLIFGADLTDNAKSFYAFVIDSNMNFAIFRHTINDDWQTVMDWRSSQLLYSGGALNHIVVVRSRSMIALFANGFVLASAVFDNNIQGDNYAGLIAWSNATPGLQAVFDNYSVCSLDQPYPIPVYVGVDDTFQVPADQPVTLHLGWLANTHSEAKSFADLAVITLTIDNQEYTGLQEYWEPVKPFAEGYGVEWNLPLALLTPGVHRIDYSLSLADQVTDGFDLDKNGKLDQYGPGQALTGWVEIDVQR